LYRQDYCYNIIMLKGVYPNAMPIKKLPHLYIGFLMLISSSLPAQSTFGIRVGIVNSNQQILLDDSKEELASKLGADIALVAEIPFCFFTLSPELHWLQKGSKISDLHGPFREASRTFNYLEIPLLVRLNFGRVLGFSFFGGPSFGYLLNGSDKDQDGSTTDIDLDFYKRTEFGAHLGGSLSVGPIGIDIRYILGLTNIFDKSSATEVTNTSLGAGVTFKF
jgi:hypothetical protein